MADNKTTWVQAMANCLTAFQREQAGSPCPVVDYEVIPDASGGADDLCVWLVCRTRAEKNDFIGTERSRSLSILKKKMLAAGFSESAVASVDFQITSRAEVEEKGGRFSR